MNALATVIGNDPGTMILGSVLVMGVLLFAWIENRRTSRLPHLGTVMVKNRLKSSS